ncbi:YlbF/YmcA family competence regulator [Streptococcus sp. KHUD_017]
MSNIYDSANALSRGLRKLPEYKAVKEARDAIQADAEASKIFADYIAFQHEIQIMAQTGQIPDASFQEKMEDFGKQIQGNSLLSEFFAKQQQLSIYLSDIEKIVFEPISELLK